MTLDVFDVAGIFVDHARRCYPDEIGIIAYYGSYAQGTATPASDLDLIYIPDAGKANALASCFLLNGVCFDFFPISWERAERLASGADGWAVGPALIADARILFARSDADRARFVALQEHIARLQSPESAVEMQTRARKAFQPALARWGSLRLAMRSQDRDSVSKEAWGLAVACVECLALYNQIYFRRGWDSNLSEIEALPKRPHDLQETLEALLLSSDAGRVQESAEALVCSVRATLQEEPPSPAAAADTTTQVFANYYPEVRDKVNKIEARCASGNRFGALWAAMFVQEEVARFMAEAHTGRRDAEFSLYAEYAARYREDGFPSLMEAGLSASETALPDAVRAFDRCMQTWLRERSIPLHSLDTLEEAHAFLTGSAASE